MPGPEVINRFALVMFSKGDWQIRLYKDQPVGPAKTQFLIFGCQITIPESVIDELLDPVNINLQNI